MAKVVTSGQIGVTSPAGYKAGGVYCGLKKLNHEKRDLGMLYSEYPASAAAVFTLNKVKAAPVLASMARTKTGHARAIVFNSGNANACVGPVGLENAEEMINLAAAKVGVDPDEVFVASTGVIGVPLDMTKIRNGLDKLQLSADSSEDAALAIMTTDLIPKKLAVEIEVGGKRVVIAGMAKGSGMIHPNMATMLGFITTDATVDSTLLQEMLTRVVDGSFNSITVDGDTSTNDCVFLLANGAAGAGPLQKGSAEAQAFEDALNQVCVHLAKAIARDGEGATKLIEVSVNGARSDREARLAARTIAGSNLLKSAVTGCDPNWGRILAALGRAGEVEVDPTVVDVTIGDITISRQGRAVDFDRQAASKALSGSEVFIRVDMHVGHGSATAWGCNLTEAYVKINSEYTT